MIYKGLNPNSTKFSKIGPIGHWYLIAFFSQKMIMREIWYKKKDKELFAIIEIFRT